MEKTITIKVSLDEKSAISSLKRKEILQKIKTISDMIKGDEKKCDKCRKPSKIFQGDYGELLCPSCYKEVIESEEKEELKKSK